MTDHYETPKKHRKETEFQLLYRVVDAESAETERRVDQAFDVLFEAVLQAELQKNPV